MIADANDALSIRQVSAVDVVCFRIGEIARDDALDERGQGLAGGAGESVSG